MSNRLCKNCEWWDAGTVGKISRRDSDVYECRRRSPQVGNVLSKILHEGLSQVGQDRENYGQWPLTAGHDWCGDFTPRPIENQAEQAGGNDAC